MPGNAKPRKKSTSKRQAKPKRPKEETAEQPFGILLTVQEDNTYAATPMGGMGPMAIPTHLRRAANELEAALTKAPAQ